MSSPAKAWMPGKLLAGVTAAALLLVSAVASAQNEGKPLSRTKTATPEPVFTRGPRVSPQGPLMEWLERQTNADGRARVVRLPITFEANRRGRIGVDDEHPGLAVVLEDTAMGVSLDDRVRMLCGGKRPCHLWLEGTWRRPSGEKPAFAVLVARRLVSESERAGPIHAEVEGNESTRTPDGFPLPAAASLADPPRGATSLAPGRNFELRFYEVAAAFEDVAAFYEREMPGAKRAVQGDEATYSTSSGTVRLSRRDASTRITISVGPK